MGKRYMCSVAGLALLLAAVADDNTMEPGMAPVRPNLLSNGAMSAGDTAPTGWGKTWGKAEALRDTEVFASAPASLRGGVEGAKGQAYQMLKGGAGRKLRLQGVLRSSRGLGARKLAARCR